MRAITHKPQPFLARAREALNLMRGKQHASNYRVQDLQNLVQYVIKSERNRGMARRGGIRNEAGTYDGARTGRTREDWGYATDVPYNELSGAHSILVARSRNLYKNDSTYRAAINTIVTNTIGTGLRPKPKVLGRDGKPDKIVNAAIEKAFWKYARRQEWDARKKMCFVGEGQRMALKTVLISGDFIMNAVSSRDLAFLPVMWQQCESDRLDTTHDMLLKQTWQSENIKQTIHGINLDEFGAPVSYLFKGISSAVPARNIIHSFMTDRPEQYIGIPAAVAALDEVFDKQDLMEDYVLKSRAIAKVIWWLSTKTDDDIPKSGDQDADSVIGLEPLSQMRTEEAPELLKMPDSIGDTLQPLVRMLQHGVCANLGTSYTTVTRDMDGVNFAASKFIDIQEWRFFSMLKDWFIDDLCNPFYEKAVQLMVLNSEIPGVSPTIFAKDPYRFYECEWTGNGKADVDPLKDISADNEGLKSGVFTMAYCVGKRGEDLDEHIEQLRIEREKLKEAGLDDLIERQAGTKTAPETANTQMDGTGDEPLPVEPDKPKSKTPKQKKQKEAVNA